MQYENERMEFKSQLTDDIYKEVIAFTNTDGGVIYIGIDDQGNVTGIDNVWRIIAIQFALRNIMRGALR